MSLIIGLTGGIGCGKSIVASKFANLGVEIIDTDQISRKVVASGSATLTEIVKHFGTKILQPTGKLDRKKLAAIVFNDHSEKTWLEQLLHPLILERMHDAINNSHSKYTIAVIPLLIETSSSIKIDRILVIDCPEGLQISRTMQRDKISEPEVRNIMAQQASREQRLLSANDILENNLGLDELSQQVEDLHNYYMSIIQG